MLSVEQEIKSYYKPIMNNYYENEARKLHNLVKQILNRKFGGIADKDMNEFYSVANDVFSDIVLKDRYDFSKGNFEGFLYGALELAIIDEFKRQNRDKRTTKVVIEVKNDKGEIERKKVSIPDVYMDAPIGDEDNSTLADYLYSDCNVEKEIVKEEYDERVERCLNGLPKVERQIIEMKMENISVETIKQKLSLSDSQYNNHIKAINENRGIIDFKTKRNKQIIKKAEDKVMSKTVSEEIIQVMDIDTTDSYRRDNNTLGSLLDDINDELSPTYINRDYISQRQPFMWSEEQINKFYTRILNNQPIPEIIICEQIINGQKISFLIDGLQRLSYAELFKNNIRPVKAKGAEFTHIKYKKRVVDENGDIKVVEEIFDIVGKKYEDLPEFLQKRFDNFNVTVTRFFNCTSEMIDYHIRNYNSHTAMNKVQYGATNASNLTVGNIKKLSQKHPFFKDIVKTNGTNIKDGSWDEVVGRTIMATYFIEDWKKEVKDVFVYLDENSETEQFTYLKNHLDNLTKTIGDNSLKELFTTGNTHIWLAVYDKFTKLGLEDSKFVNFMNKFKEDLHSEDLSEFIKNIYKSKNTRDKRVVSNKIDGLYTLMCEYLGVSKEDTKKIDCVSFVKENVETNMEDDDIKSYIELFKEDLSIEIDNNSKLMDEHNLPSMVATIIHSVEIGMNTRQLKEWLIDFFNRNNTYILNQKENYRAMANDMDNFMKKGKVA